MSSLYNIKTINVIVLFPFSDPFRFPFRVLATPHFNDDFVKHFENVFEFATYFQSALPQKCLVNVFVNPHLTGPGRDAPWQNKKKEKKTVNVATNWIFFCVNTTVIHLLIQFDKHQFMLIVIRNIMVCHIY